MFSLEKPAVSAQSLHELVKGAFNLPGDVDFEEGYCVEWAFAFSQFLATHMGLAATPLVALSNASTGHGFGSDAAQLEHCTVFIPSMGVSFDWRGAGAQSRWSDLHFRLPCDQWEHLADFGPWKGSWSLDTDIVRVVSLRLEAAYGILGTAGLHLSS
jgi:hypothetical protein